MVGLYLNPLTHAVVLCVDEKTQIQALTHAAPAPVAARMPARQTHDYRRNGLTSLYAALEVASGRVLGSRPAHGRGLPGVSKRIARVYRGRELHVVVDTRPHTRRRRCRRSAHPAVHLHFTPKGASWLNMIEAWFGILTRKSVRRGCSRLSGR